MHKSNSWFSDRRPRARYDRQRRKERLRSFQPEVFGRCGAIRLWWLG